MDPSPECQSIVLNPGQTVLAEIVRRGPGDPPQPRFNHFHPQGEIVWFAKVKGTLRIGPHETALRPGMLVYLPPMVPHDFEIEACDREWALILFSPGSLDRYALALKTTLPGTAAIFFPSERVARRLNALCEWLAEICAEPSEFAAVQRVLDLILLSVSQTERILATAGDVAAEASIGRLAPAIQLVQADPAGPIRVGVAARACNLTPDYFSRLFRACMQMSFADYVQGHRLNLAAQLVASTDLPIAQIAYRVGIASPAHLTRSFAARFGMTPSAYRRRAGFRPDRSSGA
jgi:AraC-like DNA-binding protein